VEWINLSQDRIQYREVVSTVLILWFHKDRGFLGQLCDY
jgi:hypothetical protein